MDIARLPGLWTRSLLVRPDGSRDTTTFVAWLQGDALFADLRQPPDRPDFSGTRSLPECDATQRAWLATQEGFAGVLTAADGIVTWRRELDYQPTQPFEDAARLWFEGDTLVEQGRDAPYVEHWHRDSARLEPRRETRLPDGLVVRVGAHFMTVRGRTVALPPHRSLSELVAEATPEHACALLDMEIALGRVTPEGWRIERCTLPWREGAFTAPESGPAD